MTLSYPFQCSSCQRTIARPHGSIGPGLDHAGRGLCKACYAAWAKAGRPEPVKEFHHTLRNMQRFPFDCAKCGTSITHPYGGTGLGAAHVGHGLCLVCYNRWYRAGMPPLTEFLQVGKTVFPFPCRTCGGQVTHVKTQLGLGLAHAGQGVCVNCDPLTLCTPGETR